MDDDEKTSGKGDEKPVQIPSEIAENPDVEDPRLYSPMQEADRPAPEERVEQTEVKEETAGDDKSADEKAE